MLNVGHCSLYSVCVNVNYLVRQAFTYYVTLRRVPVTFLAVEKQ